MKTNRYTVAKTISEVRTLPASIAVAACTLTAAFSGAFAQTAPPAQAPILTNAARFLPVVAKNGMAVPLSACLVGKVYDGQIVRLDEYIDSSRFGGR